MKKEYLITLHQIKDDALKCINTIKSCKTRDQFLGAYQQLLAFNEKWQERLTRDWRGINPIRMYYGTKLNEYLVRARHNIEIYWMKKTTTINNQ